ncbi:MAG TPA: tetratricopeptide repeat protein [Pirellulales bacterium]|nr:tetratricopeptide repeat protein [Pirellulales bacterium]
MRVRGEGFRWAVVVAALSIASVPLWRGTAGTVELSHARKAAYSDNVEADIDWLRDLSERRPQNAEFAFLLAVAHRRLGATVQARDVLNRAAELGWDQKDVLTQTHMLDLQSGRFGQAEPHLREMLRQGCADILAAQIYESFVKAYLSDMRLMEASLTLDYWLQWQPNSVPAHALRADVLFAARDTKRLEDEYQQTLKLAPKNDVIRLRLAYLLLDNKDVAGALLHFDAIATQRMRSDARVGWAACQRQLGNLPQAKAALEESLNDDGLSPEQRGFVLAEMAQILLGEKANVDAKERFLESLALAPGNPTTHYGLGLVLSRLGEKDEAEKQLQISRELEAKIERLADVVKEIAQYPDDPSLRCEAGEILLDAGRKDDAYMWLLSALRLERWYARAHLALARYYAESGREDMHTQHLAWAAQSQHVQGPAE